MIFLVIEMGWKTGCQYRLKGCHSMRARGNFTRIEFIDALLNKTIQVSVTVKILFVLFLLFTCPNIPAAKAEKLYPGQHWQKAESPEALGWSSDKLAAARAYSKTIDSAAVMIIDDGIVVDAWGDISRNFKCHSVRKSLLSALIGIHVDEGRINLSKTMEELGIDDNAPSLTETEKQATVADLIKARSGIYHPALGESPGMKATRPKRYSHKPGTFWYYNNWDFNALGMIFEQETGTKIFEEFEKRIAKPLDMEDFNISDCSYRYSVNYSGDQKADQLSIHPYYNFRMSTRDLSRFGLLFLREGRWQNQQIVSVDWVRDSTASLSKIGPDKGYGYMWWTGVEGGLFPNVRVKEHSFYASGYRGHRIIVLPYRKIVVVHRFDTDKREGSVTDIQIGRLLWLVLDAAGETDIGEPPYIEAAKGLRLTANNLKKALTGDFVWQLGNRGGKPLVSYLPDGGMIYKAGGNIKDTGRWWTEGDRFCRQWSRLSNGQKGSYYLVLDDHTLKWFNLNGTALEKIYRTPIKKNPKDSILIVLLLIGCAVIFLFTLVSYPVGRFFPLLRFQQNAAVNISGKIECITRFTAITPALFFLILLGALVKYPSVIKHGLPCWNDGLTSLEKFLLLVPITSTIFTALLLTITLILWLKGYGTYLFRLHCSLVVFASVIVVIFLIYWELLTVCV